MHQQEKASTLHSPHIEILKCVDNKTKWKLKGIHRKKEMMNIIKFEIVYFLYLTCSLRFLSRRKIKEKQEKQKRIKSYIAEKYLYMNDIQYLETENKRKAFVD